MKKRTKHIKLSIEPGTEPPHEFRIFTTPTVETTKGTFAFGPDEAAAVMAEYERHGADLMLDYDHASLGGTSADPALASRAAGWFNLELRNGELYAVNVRWTEPAAEALRRKEFRYISPAFQTDGDRIVAVMNVAIVNLPATRKLQPLMAASTTTTTEGETTMKTLQDALAALEAGDTDAAIEIITALLAAEPPKEEEPKPDAEVTAATARLMKLTSTSTLASAVAHVATLAQELQTVAGERDAFADAERVRLCARLVHAAGRAPATVWADPFVKGVPKPYLAAMSLSDLRAHVDDEIAVAGKSVALRPPRQGGDDEIKPREVAMCAELGVDVKSYAARKVAAKGQVSR